MYSLAIARALAPRDVTSPLKPLSRAASRKKRAKPRSFSTMSSTRSPGRMLSRSSPASLMRSGVASSAGAGAGTVAGAAAPLRRVAGAAAATNSATASEPVAAETGGIGVGGSDSPPPGRRPGRPAE